jgi:Zn-dependent M16 (insulinase) family peptidase
VLSSKLTDVKRLTEITAQTKARLQTTLSSAGHMVASMRAMSHFSKYAAVQDATRGISFYRTVCDIEKLLKDAPEQVTGKLEALVKKIFARNRLLVSFTAKEESFRSAAPVLKEYLGALEADSPVGKPVAYVMERGSEGFTDASQIQYVARAGSFAKAGYAYSGALRVLRMIMEYDYMWTNIRVKGGAYGCMAAFLRTGETYFVSYRDPNLEKTIEVYEGIPEYLRSFAPDERDMTKYIIGTFGNLDTPLNPEAKGARSMAAYMEELDFSEVQRERDEILAVTAEDIRGLAGCIGAVLDQKNLCVVGNENTIRESSGLFDRIEKLYA